MQTIALPLANLLKTQGSLGRGLESSLLLVLSEVRNQFSGFGLTRM
jgi:hypothetical protein